MLSAAWARCLEENPEPEERPWRAANARRWLSMSYAGPVSSKCLQLPKQRQLGATRPLTWGDRGIWWFEPFKPHQPVPKPAPLSLSLGISC